MTRIQSLIKVIVTGQHNMCLQTVVRVCSFAVCCCTILCYRWNAF